MPTHRQHGRRRAATRTPAPVSLGRHWTNPPIKTGNPPRRSQHWALSAAAAGFIALTALPAAHAESGHLPMAVTASSSSAADTTQTTRPVTAEQDVAISFTSPVISSKSAPLPAPALRPAAAAAATVAPSETQATPTPSGPAEPSTALRPPLASLTVTSPFGYRTNPLTGAGGELHTGIDFAGACGTPVMASGSGTVTEAGWSSYGGGNRIVVDHGGGIKTTYNHLDSIGVSVGQQITQETQIAGVGSTGNSTGCHLHFEVMVNDQTVDPTSFI